MKFVFIKFPGKKAAEEVTLEMKRWMMTKGA